MRYFLAKTEPTTYSINTLEEEKVTWWDGVHSHQAINVIKSWEIGDRVLIYHSVKDMAIVGISEVVSEPIKDPDDSRGISWKARVSFITKFPKTHWITLKEIKASGLFADFQLVKQSRLSTMACPDNFIEWLAEKGII